jgi:hypothetical protein
LNQAIRSGLRDAQPHINKMIGWRDRSRNLGSSNRTRTDNRVFNRGFLISLPTEGSDRGKTVTKPVALMQLGLALSEKQIPQVVENLESGDKRKKLWSGPLCARGTRPRVEMPVAFVD